MSVKYVPVQWNRNKIWYVAGVLIAVVAYIQLFLVVGRDAGLDGRILRMRAFGTCAFFMLTFILCIGPMTRLNRRFLPLLYNRRHFGVLTVMVAATHALHVLGWYYAFSPTDPLEALLTANTRYGSVLGFPFETLGIIALLVLAVLAATSHDFWLAFLSAPVWKLLHLLIYPAYAAVVAHVGLGYLQSTTSSVFAAIVALSALAVALLHLVAPLKRNGEASPSIQEGWLDAGSWADIPNGRARIINLPNGKKAAVFRNGDTLSAISHACAHQNGPLGEGLIIDGCVTCPWHGFQYRPEDGRSPEPFTEMVPTYQLRLSGERVEIRGDANPPGTYQRPVVLPNASTPDRQYSPPVPESI